MTYKLNKEEKIETLENIFQYIEIEKYFLSENYIIFNQIIIFPEGIYLLKYFRICRVFQR